MKDKKDAFYVAARLHALAGRGSCEATIQPSWAEMEAKILQRMVDLGDTLDSAIRWYTQDDSYVSAGSTEYITPEEVVKRGHGKDILNFLMIVKSIGNGK